MYEHVFFNKTIYYIYDKPIGLWARDGPWAPNLGSPCPLSPAALAFSVPASVAPSRGKPQ